MSALLSKALTVSGAGAAASVVALVSNGLGDSASATPVTKAITETAARRRDIFISRMVSAKIGFMCGVRFQWA